MRVWSPALAVFNLWTIAFVAITSLLGLSPLGVQGPSGVEHLFRYVVVAGLATTTAVLLAHTVAPRRIIPLFVTASVPGAYLLLRVVQSDVPLDWALLMIRRAVFPLMALTAILAWRAARTLPPRQSTLFSWKVGLGGVLMGVFVGAAGYLIAVAAGCSTGAKVSVALWFCSVAFVGGCTAAVQARDSWPRAAFTTLAVLLSLILTGPD